MLRSLKKDSILSTLREGTHQISFIIYHFFLIHRNLDDEKPWRGSPALPISLELVNVLPEHVARPAFENQYNSFLIDPPSSSDKYILNQYIEASGSWRIP